MQRWTSSLLTPVSSLIVLFLLAVAGVLPAVAGGAPSTPLAHREAAPLMFIENVGQFAQGVHFRVQGSASTLICPMMRSGSPRSSARRSHRVARCRASSRAVVLRSS